ncbi:odorant binding protein 7 [Bombus fervidus]|uniref:odorant binding protein 7 n=1 Tax=Bombus fervidus TaxID=203811 RepID=UPI003AB633D3
MKGYLAILVHVLSANILVRASNLIQLTKMLNINIKDIRQCLHKSNLTDMDLIKLNDIFQEENISHESLEDVMLDFGCFVVCVLDKANMVEDKNIRFEYLIETAVRNNFPIARNQTLNECCEKAKKQDDICKSGFVFATCSIGQTGL